MIKMLHLFSLLCALSGMAVHAGQVANLYQADVAAEGDWQQDALKQVLIRVSGKSDIAAAPELEGEFKQASAYIKQFEAIRHADGNRMRVLLDAVKVNQLLQQNNVAVWGALRPDILVWLVQQQDGNRNFVRRSEQPLNAALQQSFGEAGLPLLLPLYDMDDLLNLSETDVWAGFWQQINQASVRYRPDIVVLVAVDSTEQDGQSMLRLNWQRQENGRTYRDEILEKDESSLMQSFAASLSSQLAQQYASVMSAQSDSDYVLEVRHLTDLPALVQVQKLLQQMVGVSEVTIVRYDSDSAQYKLSTSISADDLMNALRFNPRLRLVAEENTVDYQSLNAGEQPVFSRFEYVKP